MNQTPSISAPRSETRYPSLRGRCVFVTGGATGIGAAIVSAFAAQGARVAFVDFNEEAIDHYKV